VFKPHSARGRKRKRHGIFSGEDGEAQGKPGSFSEVHGQRNTNRRLRDGGQHRRALVSSKGAKKFAQ